MRLIFYNLWHNGDIHFTRPFIRDIIKKTNFTEYQYLHWNSPKLLADIPGLIYGKPNQYCSPSNIVLKINNDEIYVNVHIGCYDFLFTDDVDTEGRSVVYTYHKLFTYIYQQLGIIIGEEKDYIPTIDYEVYNLENINTFLSNNNHQKVLVNNGPVHASQGVEIDFQKLIDQLSDEYPYVQFLLTSKNTILSKSNVFYTEDIIKAEGGDLNEISYLSQFCNIIFGRSSGPYTFCLTEKNMKDPSKVFICPSYKLRWVSWGTKSTCKFVWINKTEYDDIYSVVNTEIGKMSGLTLNDFNIRTELDKIYISPKINITSEYDLSIYFYLGDDKIWEHLNYVCDVGNEYWYQPIAGYNRNDHRIKIEFRTSKNILFSTEV